MCDEVSREFLRAIRGGRSQVAFSRRLGYRSNVCADWEQGRRMPTGTEAFRAARVAGGDVTGALTRFNPAAMVGVGDLNASGVARWLRVTRGNRSIVELAEAMGASRHAVGRWLGGKAQPRLPDLLALVDVMTGRMPDLLVDLVGEDVLPSLSERIRRTRASRGLAVQAPWSSAVLMALETTTYQSRGTHNSEWLAQWLGLPLSVVDDSLQRLKRAGVIVYSADRFVRSPSLTVDIASVPADRAAIRQHWVRAAADRAVVPKPVDLVSYNVFGVSHSDLERIHKLQRAFFREVRSIVATAEQTDEVAVLQIQLITLTSQEPG